MFCKNCGAQISDGKKFCGSCGAPVTEPIDVDKVERAPQENPSILIGSKAEESALKKCFLIVSGLMLLMLILRFVSFGKYHVGVVGYSIGSGDAYSLNEFMGSGGIGAAIYVIIVLASIAMCLLPFFKNDFLRRRRMIIPKIITIWNGFTMGLAVQSLAECVESNKQSVENSFGSGYFEGSWEILFGGWLNIAVTIAVIVMLFVISRKTKKYKVAKSEKKINR